MWLSCFHDMNSTSAYRCTSEQRPGYPEQRRPLLASLQLNHCKHLQQVQDCDGGKHHLVLPVDKATDIWCSPANAQARYKSSHATPRDPSKSEQILARSSCFLCLLLAQHEQSHLADDDVNLLRQLYCLNHSLDDRDLVSQLQADEEHLSWTAHSHT